MKRNEKTLSRRCFLQKSFLAGAGGFFLAPGLFVPKQEQQIYLWSEYTPEEKELVEHSEMAKYFENYLNKHRFNCSELIFLSCLKSLNQPETFSYAATGYGGGLGHGDLCGFLTGGIMGIGVAAKITFENPAESKEYMKYARDEYWNWFQSMAPLKCNELREKCEVGDQFLKMGQRAALKLEELLEVVKS